MNNQLKVREYVLFMALNLKYEFSKIKSDIEKIVFYFYYKKESIKVIIKKILYLVYFIRCTTNIVW